MSAESLQTPDFIGLTKVAPFSHRGFMTGSAAVTAGYTLAAGPVRADVIKTDTDGLTAGDAEIKVADGEPDRRASCWFRGWNNFDRPPLINIRGDAGGRQSCAS